MWFKKKSQISGYNPNTAYDGTDWRTNTNSYSGSFSHTLPSAADAGNYFYLPALGDYRYGQLNGVGRYGNYWSSSGNPSYSYGTYTLYFYNGGVYVNDSGNRKFGLRVGGFE